MATVKNYRQMGTNSKPNELEYGAIAISKDGDLRTGNETNDPVLFYGESKTLSEATKTLLGVATPDGALVALKTLIDGVSAIANGRSRISVGSYTGTGTFGISNKNSLTLPFVPKFVIIYAISTSTNTTNVGTFIPEAGSYVYEYTNTGSNGVVSLSDTTMTWYNTVAAANQLNATSTVYQYAAIG